MRKDISCIGKEQTAEKDEDRNPGSEEEQAEKPLTFLEKHAKEGLMSKCGSKESEATVFMGMDDASAAVVAAIEKDRIEEEKKEERKK